MPRRYDLGKRQDQKDATRDRIVAAAAELFRDQGAVRTSIAQVAAAADVAPGTVRNHFPTTDDLAAAVAAYVMVLLRMPGPEVFDGAAEPAERVAALAHAMGAYYERSAPWYGMPDLDDAPLPAWAAFCKGDPGECRTDPLEPDGRGAERSGLDRTARAGRDGPVQATSLRRTARAPGWSRACCAAGR